MTASEAEVVKGHVSLTETWCDMATTLKAFII